MFNPISSTILKFFRLEVVSWRHDFSVLIAISVQFGPMLRVWEKMQKLRKEIV
jgi:hypothetical protein